MNTLRTTIDTQESSFSFLEDAEDVREFSQIIGSFSSQNIQDLDISLFEKKWEDCISTNKEAIVQILQHMKGNHNEDAIHIQEESLRHYNRFGLLLKTFSSGVLAVNSENITISCGDIQCTKKGIGKQITTIFNRYVIDKATMEYRLFNGTLANNESIYNDVFFSRDHRLRYRMDDIEDFEELYNAYKNVFSGLCIDLKEQPLKNTRYYIYILLLRIKKIASLAEQDNNTAIAQSFDSLLEKCTIALQSCPDNTKIHNALMRNLK